MRKKDDQQTSHLILEMSMNEAFIWLSVSLTDTFLMARNCFRIFTENNPVMGSGKNILNPTQRGFNLKKSHSLSKTISNPFGFWRNYLS